MDSLKLTIGVYGIQDINDSKIPTLSHDHSIAVMQNGKVLHHAQLERLDREKNSASMPKLLFSLLKEKKWLSRDIEFVFVDNVVGRSFINKEGNIRFEAQLHDHLKSESEEARLWFLDRFTKARMVNHELAHLGSCLPFYGNFKNNSLLIHFDGGASLSNFSAWEYSNNSIKPIVADWEFKWLSSFFNANALMFGILQAKQWELNSVPGKLMGFASFGKYKKELEVWLTKNNFFQDVWGSKQAFFKATKEEFGIDIKHLNQKDSFLQDLAATLQHIFIRETLNRIEALKNTTTADHLYLSGGSALNIVLNTQLIENNWFKSVNIPPCCNDSGLALGAAAFREWEHKQKIDVHSPFLNNWGIESYTANYTSETIVETANILLEKKVIAVCNNTGEIGPRALGNRSILSLANSQKLAQKVSIEHKQREWYRPVAPIMLEKNTKYFTGLEQVNHLSSYMLLDFEILEKHKKELAGAVHVDGTARIQTVFNRNFNPFIYDLLSHLDKEHNVRALINTSFNIKGEPIVHTEEDARKSAINMQLDAVILNGKLQLL